MQPQVSPLIEDLDKLAAAMPPKPATQTKESTAIAARYFPSGQPTQSAEQILKGSGLKVGRYTDRNSRKYCRCDALLAGSLVRRSQLMWSQTYWVILDLTDERVSGGHVRVVNAAQ
jgi:hypothetical protein